MPEIETASLCSCFAGLVDRELVELGPAGHAFQRQQQLDLGLELLPVDRHRPSAGEQALHAWRQLSEAECREALDAIPGRRERTAHR